MQGKGENSRTFLSEIFFGSGITEDEKFLKILEDFDYTGEEAVKALQFAASCMEYLRGGLV